MKLLEKKVIYFALLVDVKLNSYFFSVYKLNERLENIRFIFQRS